jgi:TetR/AcrR family transcriptional repressor of nem operon
MARTSKADKAKTHETLLTVAAAQLRLRGFTGLNVSDVMKAAGLTHGGFYRHFTNKEDLAIAATRRAFSTFIERLEQDLASYPPSDALKRFVDRYLTIEHLANISGGCPVAALAADANRCTDAEHAALESGTNQLVELLDTAMGQRGQAKHMSGSALIALLSGTVNVARMQSEPDHQNQTLAAMKSVILSLDAGSMA